MGKRFLGMLAVVLTGSLALSACSGAPKAAPAGDQGQKSTQSQDVTLHFSSWRTEEIDAFKQLNAEFNKQYPNIHISYEPIKDTEYDSALDTALSTNTGPDLMYLRPFDRGLQLYKKGYLINLDETQLPNLKDFSKTQRSVYTDEQGHLYGLPYIYVSWGFLYNKDIFAKYNLQEPKTWDDFFSVLDTLKKNKVAPLALGLKDPWVLDEVVSMGNYANFVGGEPWRQDLLQGKAKLTDPGFVSFLKTLQRWKDYMPENYAAVGYTDAQQMFLAGQAAIFPGGSWEIGYFKGQNPNLKLGIFTSPVVKAGDKQWLGFNGGAGVGINKQSKHIKETLTYVNWLASKQGQIMTGNLMPGLYPGASIDVKEIKDPEASKWIAAAGPNGENFAIGWALEKINSQEPGAGSLDMDNVASLLNGQETPEQAADKMQKGIASWYKPWQGK